MKSYIYTMLLLFFSISLTAQTNMEEFMYLTGDYSLQIEKGEPAIKDGYFIRSMKTEKLENGSVEILYFFKNDQLSPIPLAGLLIFDIANKKYPICIPHPATSGNVRAISNQTMDDFAAKGVSEQKALRAGLVAYSDVQAFYYREYFTNNSLVVKPISDKKTPPKTIVIEPKTGEVNFSVVGDLRGREITAFPEVNNTSPHVGNVVVSVCIDRQGRVTRAKATTKNSTTTSPYLWGLAEQGAKDFAFKTSSNAPDSQCGYIMFKFK